MSLVMIPDVQKAVSDYLRDRPEVAAIVGRRVVAKTPGSTDAPWVRVTRLNARPTGRDSADHLQGFLMQFDCYAGGTGGLPESNLLGRTVRGVLQEISAYRGGDAVFSTCRIVGDISIPDDTVDEPARDRTIITATIWGHA